MNTSSDINTKYCDLCYLRTLFFKALQALCWGTVIYCQSYILFCNNGDNNGISKNSGAVPPASTNKTLCPLSANFAAIIAPEVPAPTAKETVR